MKEVFARVDDIFARITRQDGGMVAERYDPGSGQFVSDPTYFSKLRSPEHAGVDSYWGLTQAEFDAEVAKLKA